MRKIYSFFVNKLFKTLPLDSEAVALRQRYIYLLPTTFGWIFILLFLTMLICSANYHNNLGYALSFLLGCMALVSILHTFRNLCGLTLRPGKAKAVFAGNTAWYDLYLGEKSFRSRPGLQIRGPEGTLSFDVQAGTQKVIAVPAIISKRGLHALGQLTLSSTYPLGLVRAWSKIEVKMTCLAYPKPEEFVPSLDVYQKEGRLSESAADKSKGVEEFTGLKNYQFGDSYKRIDWKAFSRGRGLWSKQFQGGGTGVLWLDWYDFGQLDLEARLSRLCRLVLQAERNKLHYGLHLPGQSIAPDQGREHKHKCLTALALY